MDEKKKRKDKEIDAAGHMSFPASDASAHGIKVLLVEDEPLVAMGIADQLTAAGAVIVGPCATMPIPIGPAQFEKS